MPEDIGFSQRPYFSYPLLAITQKSPSNRPAVPDIFAHHQKKRAHREK
jgi:hypothetical protein